MTGSVAIAGVAMAGVDITNIGAALVVVMMVSYFFLYIMFPNSF